MNLLHHPVIGFNASGVPHELREMPRWIGWRYEQREGRLTKVPASLANGHAIAVTEPSHWQNFDTALDGLASEHSLAGLGVVFSGDGLLGIDLDGCVDERGSLTPEAREILDALGSYAEYSPSGTGVKVFARGSKPRWARCRSKSVAGMREIEIYDNARFFTVTGHAVDGCPREIRDATTPIHDLCKRLWPGEVGPSTSTQVDFVRPVGDDAALIDRAFRAANGGKFRSLWNGDTSLHGGDDSAADLALCCMLAFWTGKDAVRMDRLFRRSGLFREKWNEKRGDRTYGQMTIEKANADCQETYTPRRGSSSQSEASTPGDVPEPGEGDDLLVPLGHKDPATGRLVLSPRRTLPTAEAYAHEFNQHSDGRTLHGYGGVLMEWRGNRYCQVEEEWLEQRLLPWLHKALRYLLNKQTGEMELVDFESNPTTVKQALETIRAFVHLPASTVSPSWLGSGKDRPPALELLPCKSMNLHIPSGQVLAPTPALFTINALDFDYDPNPEPPERWVKFLEQLFGDDLESVDLLQEWMGYCLTGDTSQQKMLLLVGPRRSGKGTIGRIITRLVGAGNVVGPTTSSLAGNFGLQPLIEKSLAIVSDARFGGDNVGTVVERLLCISGEDTLTIDRKFLGSVSMKLATRFMFLTNELPRLNDASTALAGRFLVLRLTNTFYGTEDVTLTDQLLAELPGILLWAIEGWKRLRQRGRFVQPKSGEDAIRDMEDLGSPVGAFIRDRCVVGTGHRAWVDDLYNAWQVWCEHDGRNAVSTKQAFGRDLMAAAPGVARRRGTGMVSFYEGISLRTEVPE